MVPALTRAFLAVPAGERFCRELSTRLDGWRDRLPVKWTQPPAWHVTLQFLGDWPSDRLDRLAAAMDGLGALAETEFAPAGLGGFPDLRRPRVLILHGRQDAQLAAVAVSARKLVTDVWPDGPQDTRPFRPHLTLARVRTFLADEYVKLLPDIDLTDLPPFPVTAVELLASELAPGGARHTVLARRTLRKKGE